eukprot:TRINITY_DN2991_c0_g1_i4.p1 TRINITY_DN2991_c0_g1~~TRINITY_DN2991_c0_g1_i4.p1  ORF type:complete len:268 (+),score=38.19 TRINITY_DN2991_c0_g1_i4:297-1100(+)
MDNAYKWIISNQGLDAEDDCQYTAADGTCVLSKEDRKLVTIDSYADVPVNNETAMKQAVFKQPVGVAIEADADEIQLYSSGVLNFNCGTDVDHGVLVVGYGTDPAYGDYWLIKNSWGETWGENGFFRLKRNVAAPEGMCGIATMPCYPIKNSPSSLPSPPPPPSAVACDATHACSAGQTCCCYQRSSSGSCLTWGCCQLPNAICCSDGIHCCPSDYPICSSGGLCYKNDLSRKSKMGAVAAKKKSVTHMLILDKETSTLGASSSLST